MGITGWISHTRDLSHEWATLEALAAGLTVAMRPTDVVRLARHAGFAHRSLHSGYADWRHPERPDPDVVVLTDTVLTHRDRLEHTLYQQPRPLAADAEVILHA